MKFEFDDLKYFQYCFLCANENISLIDFSKSNIDKISLFNIFSIKCKKCPNQASIFHKKDNLFDLNYQYIGFDNLDVAIDYVTNNLRFFNKTNSNLIRIKKEFEFIPTLPDLKNIYKLLTTFG